MRFASFLSGGFITAIVVNPPERKLAKRTSVHWDGPTNQSAYVFLKISGACSGRVLGVMFLLHLKKKSCACSGRVPGGLFLLQFFKKNWGVFRACSVCSSVFSVLCLVTRRFVTRKKIRSKKKQGAKNQGHCYSKREEVRLPILFLNNNEPVFWHPAFFWT